MSKLWKILDSRIVAVLVFLVISPYWFAYVAQKTLMQSFPFLAASALKPEVVEVEKASGVKEIVDVKQILASLEVEFVKINPSKWPGKQEALFRIKNASAYALQNLSVNAVFYDENGKVLDARSTMLLSNTVYHPGAEQFFKFDYDYERRLAGEKSNIGLAHSAKAAILGVDVVQDGTPNT
ncbi:hypothetical protein [Ketobacter alkanivorans]|uniref:Uncharacterized protein n=1 Tax=Ketobacter alkanivorans TaxID=1917421 RepID=A0A2K9LL06_9GAMM|nr:hypothetical protein [Ketobacter alkanivorans]AUM13039.1 hypothetical protein Kalk_11665 [Ketobacter alkanivorans]